MPVIPAFMLKKLYVKGSQMNTYTGFRLQLKNTMAPGTIIGVSPLNVDGTVYPPEKIMETQPDYVLILPWNLRTEICEKMAGIREWGGRFVVPIPEVEVLE